MKKIKLDDYIEEISMGPFGSDITIDNFVNSGIPVLNGSNLTQHKLTEHNFNYLTKDKADKLRKANAFRGDVVFTHRGTLGQASYIPHNSKFDRYVISQSQFRVRFDDNIDPIYFTYLIKSEYGQRKLLSFKNHVGVPALAQATTNFRNLEIEIEDPKAQKIIVNILRTIDEKIEINNKINSEIEDQSRLIYNYWFTQFDFTNTENSPYRISGGEMVIDEIIKREIPFGWKYKPLDEIAKIIMGQSPKGSSYNEDQLGIPLLNGPADYEQGSLVGRIYTTEPTRLCKKDDLVFCVRATIGNLTYAEKEFCLGRGVAAVRVNEHIYSEYIYFALLQEIERFKIQATGSIIVGITKDDLTDSQILMPPVKLIEEFHKIVRPMFAKIRSNKAENLELISLRDWLLPMLMTGQVSIGEKRQ